MQDYQTIIGKGQLADIRPEDLTKQQVRLLEVTRIKYNSLRNKINYFEMNKMYETREKMFYNKYMKINNERYEKLDNAKIAKLITEMDKN